jgi:hypothetical protein
MRLAKHVLTVHRDASEDATARHAGTSVEETGGNDESAQPNFNLKRYPNKSAAQCNAAYQCGAVQYT